MDFWRRALTQRGWKVRAAHRESFFNSFAGNQLRRDTRNSDRRFAAKGLESRLIDNPLSVDLFKFHPHAQHIAAIFAPNCSNGVRLVELAQIFWVSDGFLNPVAKILSCIHSFTPSDTEANPDQLRCSRHRCHPSST